MKINFVLLPLCLLFIAGCVYKAPLAKKQGLPLDPKLLGSWKLTEASLAEEEKGGIERLLFEKGQDGAYRIVAKKQDGEDVFTGYPARLDGIDFLVVKVPMDQGEEGDAAEAYQVARLEIDKAGKLTIGVLNPEYVGYDLETTEALQEAFGKNKGKADLFKPLDGSYERADK